MSDIQARLRFDITQFQNALNQVRGEIKELKATAKSSGKGLGNAMFGPLKGAIAGLGMAKLSSEVFDAVLRFDTLEKTLRVTEGSAEGAARRFAELREVGRNPGLSLEAAVKGDIRLRAIGFSADESRRIILEMGNALSLVGGTQEDLDGVFLALTQISSKGKVMAQEINQLGERLPQVRKIMMDTFGTANSEAIQEMGLDANEFIRRLVDGFAELDRAQPGLREDLTELGTIFSILANEAFSPLIHEIIPGFRELASVIAENKTGIASFGSTAGSAFRELINLGKFADEIIKAVIAPGEIVLEETADKVTTRKATFAEAMMGLGKKKKPKPEVTTPETDPFKGVIKPGKPGAAGGAGNAAAGGDKKKPDLWKEADKQLKLQRQIADMQKKMAEDGLSIQDKVIAKQKEVTDAQQLESVIAKDGTAEAKLQLELKRLELQHELNRLLDEQSRAIHQAAQDIDREVDEERKLAAETAKTTAEKKKQRDGERNDSMRNLEVLRLLARGKDKKAEQVERKKRIEDYAAEYRKEGASEEFAMKKAQERADLEDKIERRKKGLGSKIGGVKEKHMMGSLADFDRDQLKRPLAPGERPPPGYKAGDLVPVRPNGLDARGRREGRMMGRPDEGSLRDRATRAAGDQDSREKQDTSTKDLLGQIASILTTGLLG